MVTGTVRTPGAGKFAARDTAIDPRSFVRAHDLLRDRRTSFGTGSTELAHSREFMCFLGTHDAARQTEARLGCQIRIETLEMAGPQSAVIVA